MKDFLKLYAFFIEGCNWLYLFRTHAEAQRQMELCSPRFTGFDWHYPDGAVLEMCGSGFLRATGITPVPGVIYEVRVGIDLA